MTRFPTWVSDIVKHSDLLYRMTCVYPGQRPAVVSDHTAAGLTELLKFRHFARYYFQFNHDRDKLAFLGSKVEQLLPTLRQDLKAFRAFLGELAE